jgi:hypothetical protein
VPPRQSKHGVRIVEPILKRWASTIRIEAEADIAKIRPAIDEAYARSRPTVLLIEDGRHDEA